MLGQSSNYAFNYATIMPTRCCVMLNYARFHYMCVFTLYIEIEKPRIHTRPCPKHNFCLNRKIMPTLHVGIRIILLCRSIILLTKSQDYAKYYAWRNPPTAMARSRCWGIKKKTSAGFLAKLYYAPNHNFLSKPKDYADLTRWNPYYAGA